MSIALKNSINYLIYGAMVELMLESYSSTNKLTYFDPALLNKHKNLVTNWKRESKKIFEHIEKSGDEVYIRQYHSIVTILESILKSIGKGEDHFTGLMVLIDEYEGGNIQIVEDG